MWQRSRALKDESTDATESLLQWRDAFCLNFCDRETAGEQLKAKKSLDQKKVYKKYPIIPDFQA